MSLEIESDGPDRISDMGAVSTKPLVMSPSQAAARMGIPVSSLVAIMRRRGSAFTRLATNGQPGDRGRNRWGLTEAQLRKIVDGEQAKTPNPEAVVYGGYSPVSPDGKSRVRRGPGRVAPKG